ncbi:MAG TPA: aminopeptidase [Verrucomicrobiae bacterium]|nr:aminopeptidase [Verrucomicrobiae bacterium]
MKRIFTFFKKRRVQRWILALALIVIVGVVSGCNTLSFYAQAAKGQYQIFAHQQRVSKLIADPATPEKLKHQLELVQQLRVFAAKKLKLPVDDHYLKYVDLHRPYVVWNVQAASRFSLQPKTWWYPLVGSLEYRGYFSKKGAMKYGAKLERDGYDVSIGGVEAYSTLGWFNDPLLNTFVFRAEPQLAEVIFHELGHQRLFARGDTDFNEAFATVVGQEGARRWLRAHGKTNQLAAYEISLRRNTQFVHLIMSTRARLEKIYGDTHDANGKVKAAKHPPASPAKLEEEKKNVFDDLRRQYGDLKNKWGGDAGYDYWFSKALNNAQLNTIANYYDYVPGFEQLLKLNGGDMEKFYKAAERLSKKSQEDRHQWLRDLGKMSDESS